MKITQTTQFQPITIVLETKEEAPALWDFLCKVLVTKAENKILTDFSSWFSNEAQL